MNETIGAPVVEIFSQIRFVVLIFLLAGRLLLALKQHVLHGFRLLRGDRGSLAGIARSAQLSNQSRKSFNYRVVLLL